MPRTVTVAAAQMGPVQRDHDRDAVVKRLVDLLQDAHGRGAELVVFPELALTTFFPRWFVTDIAEFDHFYERSMPNAASRPLVACHGRATRRAGHLDVLAAEVAHIEDADSDWLVTLRCGHQIQGRPTVFSRRHCPSRGVRS